MKQNTKETKKEITQAAKEVKEKKVVNNLVKNLNKGGNKNE